jgi:hypothetical protein
MLFGVVLAGPEFDAGGLLDDEPLSLLLRAKPTPNKTAPTMRRMVSEFDTFTMYSPLGFCDGGSLTIIVQKPFVNQFPLSF